MSKGAAAARAAGFQQRGLKPAAVLIGAFEIHHRIRSAVLLCASPARSARVFEVEGVGRAGIEPHVENVVDLAPLAGIMIGQQKTRRRTIRVPGIRAFPLESLRNARIDRGSLRMSTLPSGLPRTNTVIGTPQARWREITQSGRLSIMPVMRFSPCERDPARAPDGCKRAGAQCILRQGLAARIRDRLIHRDEPLRRIAKNHRFLRAPGVRILVLEAAARDQHAGVHQSLDDGLVGVALLAFVRDHALCRQSPAPASVKRPSASTV